jgi:hypothetical protein
MRVTQPFDASTLLSIDPERCRRVDFAQGRESFDLAQDRVSLSNGLPNGRWAFCDSLYKGVESA